MQPCYANNDYETKNKEFIYILIERRISDSASNFE